MNRFYITARKIFWMWIAFVAIFSAILYALPHRELTPSIFTNIIAQGLLALIAGALVKHESNSKNKFIFVNFAILFAVPIIGALALFIGPKYVLLTDDGYAYSYFRNYIGYGAYAFVLTFAVVYLTVDALFREFKTFSKYLIAFSIAGMFFGLYFHGFLLNPKYAYTTQDIMDWKTMDEAARSYVTEHKAYPDPAQLSASTDMYVWKSGYSVATLHPEARDARVAELYPYLADKNYEILLSKPVNYYVISMCVVAIGFILLFFGYQYMKDPPQGAYIEKMVFMLLLFCSLEILHAWAAIKALDWQTFAEIAGVGYYVTVAVLLLIAVFFGLRLRFIMSVKGEFYEAELEQSPTAVTRWRDALDTIVVESFFNRKLIHGRLFAPASRNQNDSHSTSA
jgi:hypothetical protein